MLLRCCNTCADEDYGPHFRLMEGRRLSCEALALALCDPMRRRSFEEDSLPDSGMSTLRSNMGYDYEHQRSSLEGFLDFQAEDNITTESGDTSDTEV